MRTTWRLAGPVAHRRRRPRARWHIVGTGVDTVEFHRVLHPPPAGSDTALLVGDVLRLRRTDHRLGFRGTGGAQGNPVREVGLELVDPDTAGVQRLGGQQQMHPQRPADAADPVEQRDEIGVVLQKLGELVDDDEQCRQRSQIGPAFTMLLVLGHPPGERTGGTDLHTRLAQNGLPAVQLTGQHLTHPADQLGLLLHVGDHRRGMRQLLHAEEGGATLEVGEQQIHLVRVMRRGQRQDQGAQEL